MKARPAAKTTKRNPQDATRRHDVAPLRRRIEKLEAAVRELRRRVTGFTRVGRSRTSRDA